MAYLAAALLLPLFPHAGASAFSLLVYGSTDFPGSFSAEALEYIRLTHGVLGAVMAGWFMTLLLLTTLLPSRRARLALVAGLALWYTVDTAYSLVTGYWQNAVLNTAMLLLILVALRVGPRR